MKILLVSQYFWPESFRINDLADELIKKGHEVSVLTGKPNYPSGDVFDGYKWWGYAKEKRNSINIIRVPLVPRGNGSGLRLMLNYLSFVFFSCFYILFHREKYDVSLTFAISPITQIYAALLHKKLCKSKSYIWVQDLWPESVSATGKLKNKWIMKLLSSMVRGIYNKVDGILIQSKSFENSIKQFGDYTEKIHYVPNWAEDVFLESSSIDKEKYSDLLPLGFKILFAGNIGEAQDFDSIIKAVELTKSHKKIKWIIVGDGRSRSRIEKIVKEKNLTDSISFIGRYPLEEMPNFLVHADVTLVTLKNEEIFSLTIPSKVQSYMAFGKPIVTMIDGIGNEIVQEANCGCIASAGDYKTLADNIIKLSESSENELLVMGGNSKQYYLNNFSKNKIIDSVINIFNN